MQEALTIPAGSAVQVAFLVTPLLVLAGVPLGAVGLAGLSAPGELFTLTFAPVQLLVLALAIFVFAGVTHKGEINWLEGLQLLALYIMIAAVAFALPGR
jgi:Ca2+:H+ antiporter